ncbi:alpha/beta hydrolase [Neotabrizicola sp. VNH66]|uniref:alpha/beta hydrolase n=1 Tax=Neotabrizicola sp. VNH66 TaxID=3400918 RepID=UPI003C0F42D0
MRRALWIALAGMGALAALLVLGPREGVDRKIAFDAKVLGDDPDLWLEISEQQFPDIRPGAAKRILWAKGKGVRTPLSIVYIHGFSATAEEIRPVPDEVARALGANLYFTRLAGHGRTPEAMAEPAAGDWIEDMAEAMAVGRAIGDRVLVIGTSTGGTLAAIAATDPELSRAMAGVVLLSPSFRLRPMMGRLLDLPFVRLWGPLLVGRSVGFEPLNADHARYWITRYPTAALFPMAALMREARAQDYSAAKMPLLVFYAPADQVIDTDAIAPVIAGWGGAVEVEERRMSAGDDPWSHILAGDVLSPGQTEAVIALILNWAGRL